MLKERIERLLETYTFEELLEFNDLETLDVIEMMYQAGWIILPNPEPLG
jgi:hypothetical protein